MTGTAPPILAFEGFFNAVPHALIVADADGVILHVNTAAERLFGYDEGEMLGMPIDALVPEPMRAGHADLRRKTHADGRARMLNAGRELMGRRKDGSAIPLLIGVAPWASPDGPRAIATLMDNSARHEAEARANAEYHTALELGEFSQAIIREAASGIIIYEAATGTCILANAAAARITGVPVEQLLAQNFRTIESWVASGLREDAERALAERRAVERDVEYTTTAGKSIAISVEFLAISLRDRLSLVMMMDDRTDRRHLEQQLRVAQKMEAVGQLAGGVAHDFNNLLTVIGTYSSLLLGELPEGDARREDVAEIFNASTRAAALTRQLLAFGRRQLLDARDIDLNDSVTALERMLRRVISAEITLEFDLESALDAIHADPGQLEQAVMNLVVNARDAMPSGGRLRIETRNVEVVPGAAEQVGMASAATGAPPGAATDMAPVSMVMLRVSDTGTGMDAQTRARIFEPFFTTKGPGRGSGLGLSTTYGIVKQSGGFIRVASTLGEGTSFALYFPRVSAPIRRGAAPSAASGDAKGTGTVLVAEDDEHVRRIIVSALRERGYTVVEAGDGVDALAAANAMAAPPTLLLTDVVMPRLNGRELSDRLRERWPALKVLFTSAHAVDEAGQALSDLPGALLRKPFVPAELGAAVRAAIAVGEA